MFSKLYFGKNICLFIQKQTFWGDWETSPVCPCAGRVQRDWAKCWARLQGRLVHNIYNSYQSENQIQVLRLTFISKLQLKKLIVHSFRRLFMLFQLFSPWEWHPKVEWCQWKSTGGLYTYTYVVQCTSHELTDQYL